MSSTRYGSGAHGLVRPDKIASNQTSQLVMGVRAEMKIGLRSTFLAIAQDLAAGENLDVYVSLTAVTVLAALSISGTLGAQYSIAGLLFGMGALISLLLGMRRRTAESQTALSWRIWRFYPNRENFPTIQETVGYANHELYVFGVQLALLAHAHLSLLTSRAQQGCLIRLAFLNPYDATGARKYWINEIGRVHTFNNLAAILDANITRVLEWHSGLPEPIKQMIEIRCFDSIPTATAILFDPEYRNRAIVHYEPIIDGVAPQDRPSFRIRAADNPELFQTLRNSLMATWNSAVVAQDIFQVAGGNLQVIAGPGKPTK